MKPSLSDLKQMFSEQVTTDHIKYDWDSGHSYSYIDHPLMKTEFNSLDEQDEWEEFVNEWLYENDDCPPCEISVVNNIVESGCGCYDHLDIRNDKDRMEIENIIKQLTDIKNNMG